MSKDLTLAIHTKGTITPFDAPREIEARLVPRGQEMGFDRSPNERTDRVAFIEHAHDGQRFLGSVDALTIAKVSGTLPFEVSSSNPHEFYTIPPNQAKLLSDWARASVARLTAERGETVTHGSSRIIKPV